MSLENLANERAFSICSQKILHMLGKIIFYTGKNEKKKYEGI